MTPSPGEPRFLHQRSQHGYTSRRDQAMHGEPEAVSADEQDRQTREADRRWRQELQREWGVARDGIVGAVEQFKSTGRLDRRLVSDVRVIERQVGRIDRDIGLGS